MIKDFEISIWIMLGLLISSIFPYIQIILLYINSGITDTICQVLPIDDKLLSVILNILGALYATNSYLKSTYRKDKVTNAILLIFFINMLSMHLFGSMGNTSNWFSFLPLAIFTGTILIISDWYASSMKDKTQ